LTAKNAAWDAFPVVSADGKKLAYLAMSRPGFEADRYRIILRDLATGNEREVAPNWDRSPGTLTFSADGKTLYATAQSMGKHPLFAIDIASGNTSELGGDGNTSAFVLGRDRIVFARDDLKSPADLYSTGLKGGAVNRLTNLNADALKDIRFGDFEQFSFKGANDETVYGYLVKPVDFDPRKKYPVAFMVHGGPQGSFSNNFHYRWNSQFYAGAGFAAIMIDFHGSTGYGQKFTDAISGDWGGKPLEDLQKGMAYALQKYSFLNGDKACALGGSYGGYMMNWINGNWHDFKCLVSHASIFDNRFMTYTTEELWFDEWEHGGTQYDKPAAFEKHNPINFVKEWKTPTLVIHGQMDFRVPFEQGIGVFTALQRKGIDSQFLVFPDENHWILKPQNSLLWHKTVLDWLQKYTQ
jgi:dipeptidyl aminopeptidase/acylaminoacyl peptidase